MQLIIQAGGLGPKWFHVTLRTLILLASSESMLKSHYIAERLGEDPTFVRKILSKLAIFVILQKGAIVEQHE